MERLFRSLKTEWVPSTGYMSAGEAHRDISYYLMQRYSWIRPHQFDNGGAPASHIRRLPCAAGVAYFSFLFRSPSSLDRNLMAILLPLTGAEFGLFAVALGWLSGSVFAWRFGVFTIPASI